MARYNQPIYPETAVPIGNQYLLFLTICPSIDSRPGPMRNSVTKVIKKSKGSSCLLKGSSACTIKAMTDMLIIRGIKIILLMKPRIRKIEQKNSAKMTSCNESAGPNPMGSAKVFNLSLKLVIFAHPWVRSMAAEPTLSSSKAISTAKGLLEKMILFIWL
jgi:hypothetical protein